MEFKTKKEIIYRINHQTVCTYEMDDTPPFEINPQALDIALQIGMLMNYKMVGEIHIARKQYLDGSIPTGFQRTTIVGVDGWIPYKNRKIGLIQLGLEEDACREVSDIGHQRIYITDRLGMPLIETVTQPQMVTPQEVADVANILRWIVRSTGRVRTGIGAARQDVNVSISGGTRIEIKGVPRIPMIPRLIYNEVMRQYALLKIRDVLHKRGITEKTFRATNEEVTSLVSKSAWQPIAQAVKQGEQVHCVNLKGYSGVLSQRTQTGKTFSKEISDRVRVIACLTRLPNILTSESTEETIDSHIWHRIRKRMQATSHDALILVWGPAADMETAVNEIKIRAREAAVGIPQETRQALADSTNGFERILPGAERMYPDTDLPPIEITESRLQKLDALNPPPLWEREKQYQTKGVPQHLIIPIASSPRAAFFEEMTERYRLPVVKTAVFLFEHTKHWQRKGLDISRLREADWERFFEQAAKHPPLWQKGTDIFETVLSDSAQNMEEILKQYTNHPLEEKTLRAHIAAALKETDWQDLAQSQRERFLMGRLMLKIKGLVPAETVRDELKRQLKQKGGSHA
jgi:glutamyl-tRNA(Gln) amidotransferase subunit E